MSGKPAARQGDMTQYGGPIVQGSAGVRIGAPTGVACSVCPGGMTSGNPVNPLLGAKVLPGETDLALPGPLPFILSRTYSSYRTRTPAPVGVFGPGWKAPSDIRLQLRDDALVLNDNGGRSIHFEPLLPGEAVYSRSESMWLVRGGKAAQPDGHTLARLWGALPPDIRLSPHLYLATNSAQGPWWILGWSERVVAHRYAGRPEMRYRYDDTGRVVEQLNPAGLSYRYLYEQDRITVTDSLNRREVLHTEGGAGLKRVVKKELADGSVTRSGYDAAGRLTAQTDAAGRRTEYGLNVVSGDITDITTPDGRETKFYYNDGNQLT
ncbi:TPA: RHS repeat protein, partial [Escherichia coli]|nr:RHS repeat protein [Escherichia coli]